MPDIIHSEIGTHPADWSIQRVDSLFDIQQGKSVSKAHREGSNQKPFLRTKNVFWGQIDFAELDHMHFTNAEETRLKLRAGDLLLCEGGDVGRTAIWNNQMEDCYYQNHLHRLRAKVRNEVDPQFVLYWFWYAFEIANIYIGRSNVTTIPNLSQSKLSELQVPKPEFGEQRLITHVLNTVQTAIEQQGRLIALTRELKSTMLHKLLTEGLYGEKQKKTDVGLIPEGWETIKLGDLVNIQTGKLDSNAANPFGQYPFFTCSPETYRIDTFAFDTEAILLAGNNARGIFSVKHYKGKFNAYQRTYVLTQKDENQMPYSFLLYAIASNLEHLRTVSIGTSTKYLTLGILQNLPIIKPEYEEAKEVGNALALIDNKIEIIEQKKQMLEELFRTLLHQLMTGQIRVPTDITGLKDL